MDLTKQHILLNLLASGRYDVDLEAVKVYSNIGKERRILAPNLMPTGYRQYGFDIGFNQKLIVFAHIVMYLAKWREVYDPVRVIDHMDRNRGNDHYSNLRCITQKENVQGDWRNRKHVFKSKIRLPIDQREDIRTRNRDGMSQLKLAKEYGITRQTVARIIRGL